MSSENNKPLSSGKFLLLSDVHLDPFYGTPNAEIAKQDPEYKYRCQDKNAPPFSSYGCDSSGDLVLSTIINAAQVLPRPDFILYTGDGTRHSVKAVATKDENATAIVHESIGFFFDAIHEYFPDVPIVSLPVLDLGNNDFKDDYMLEITSTDPCMIGDNGSLPKATNPWLEDMVNRFPFLFLNDEEASVFACGGYLFREIAEDLYIIVLNTVIWSNELNTHHDNTVDIKTKNQYEKDIKFDPFGQHQWLENILEKLRSNKKKVYITGHIPPMVMSYPPALGINLMYETHVHRFYNLVSQYNDVISGHFFGHVHSNEIRHLPPSILPENHPPMFISGSISPCYFTTPFFHIVEYDKGESKFPIDFATYNADLDNLTTIELEGSKYVQFSKLFPSFLKHFNINAFTNSEIRKLSGDFLLGDFALNPIMEQNGTDMNDVYAKNDELWSKYWNNWHKGLEQPPYYDEFRLKEVCVLACGFTTTSWIGCLMDANNARHIKNNIQCTLPHEAKQVWAINKSKNLRLSWTPLKYKIVSVLIGASFFMFACWICVSIRKILKRRFTGHTPIKNEVRRELDNIFDVVEEDDLPALT